MPNLSVLLVDSLCNIFEAGTHPVVSENLVMSLSTLKMLCRYEYDALDRLIGVGPMALTNKKRFYQDDYLITELGEQTQRTSFRHQDQPLAQIQNEAGVIDTSLLLTNQAHSLLQAVSAIDSRQFAYTAYGHHPVDSGLSRLLGFNGECPDAITGHYPLGRGHRFFNPVLMRFNTPDEMSPFDDGGINSYAYCENDPINNYDPTGNSLSKFFRPWNWAEPTQGLDLIKSPSGIIKNPLNITSRNARGVGQPVSAKRNPILEELLDRPQPNLSGPTRSIFSPPSGGSQTTPARGPGTSATQQNPSTVSRVKLEAIAHKYDQLLEGNPGLRLFDDPQRTKKFEKIIKSLNEPKISRSKRNRLSRKGEKILLQYKENQMRQLDKASSEIRN